MDNSTRRFVLIDNDAGIDDAFALLAAFTAEAQPALMMTIVAITTVAGNTGLQNVTRNVATLLRDIGRQEIPLFMGNSKPLINEAEETTDGYFGSDGFGDSTELNKVDLIHANVQHEHAALTMIRLAHAYKGQLTIIVLGPLTNVALAVNLDPTFSSVVKELWVVGGNIRGGGNVRPHAEFNSWFDPEAAYVVLASKFASPIKILPWETCHEPGRLPLDFKNNVLLKLNTTQSNFLAKVEKNWHAPDQVTEGTWSYCDVLLMTCFINSWIITETVQSEYSIELVGTFTRGMMVRRMIPKGQTLVPNGQAISNINVEEYKKTLYWGLGGNIAI